jgi:hypothetical protein
MRLFLIFISMLSRIQALAAALLVLVLTSGCAASLRTPRIADIQRNPGRYQDRTVSIDGTVTESWGVPVVPYRYYRVEDGTGEMIVLSQSLRTPTRGARVRVKGTVDDFGVLAGQAIGLHMREESLKVERR